MHPSRNRKSLRQRCIDLFGLLPRCAIRRPRLVLAVIAAATLAAVPGIFRLRLKTDGHALVPPTAPEVIYDRKIRDGFGIQDKILVLVNSGLPDGIYNPGTLQLVRNLTSALERIDPGQVTSLATEPGFRFQPGTWTLRPLLAEPLQTKTELDRLRDDLRRLQLYTGTLVSSNGQFTVLLVGVPDNADRSQLCDKVLRLIAAQKTAPDQVAVTGAPVAEALLGTQILEDLGVPKMFLGPGVQSMTHLEERKPLLSLQDLRVVAAGSFGLMPLALSVMLLVLLFYFRTWPAVLLPLPGVLAALLFVFGMMGWFNVPIYLTTAAMPVLLMVLSITNDIYLFNRYFRLLRENPARNHIELLGETFEKLARPVACTSLAAVMGFVSFGFSPLLPVRAFGLFTGVGALFSLFFSLTAIPALLALVKPTCLCSQRHPNNFGPFRLEAWFMHAGQAVVRHRGWWLGGALAILALTPLGLRRLTVQDSWINGFDPQTEFRCVTSQVNDHFFGVHQLFVVCDAPQKITGDAPASAFGQGTLALPVGFISSSSLVAECPIKISVEDKVPAEGPTNVAHAVWQSQIELPGRVGDRFVLRLRAGLMTTNFWPQLRRVGQAHFEIAARSHVRPDVIQEIGDLENFIRQRDRCAVGGVLGPWDYVTTSGFVEHPDAPNARRLPDNEDRIQALWNFYGMARGESRLRQAVDTNYSRSLTTVFLKDANFADTARLMRAIRNYERTNLTPLGVKLSFAGDVAVSQSLIRGIVSTQLQSLFWSLLGIFAVTAFLGRSWRWGLLCLLPSLLAVVIKFAVMGWADIPLGVATSMFAAMTLGIGVNCAIHLLEGFDQARAAGQTTLDALCQSLRLTGPPAFVNTLAMSLGFGVLMLSQVPANARLGILLVLGLLNCFVISLLLLPALLHWGPIPRKSDCNNVR